MTDADEIPFEKLPFEQQLVRKVDEARAKGEEMIALPEVSWQAALVISNALKAYFAHDAPQRCFVCDATRETRLDRGIERLHEEGMRFSMAIADLEAYLDEKFQRKKPTDDQVTIATVNADMRSARDLQRMRIQPRPGQTIPISAELRAKLIGEQE